MVPSRNSRHLSEEKRERTKLPPRIEIGPINLVDGRRTFFEVESLTQFWGGKVGQRGITLPFLYDDTLRRNVGGRQVLVHCSW